jgi:alkylhydroperoxidase family enzyme
MSTRLDDAMVDAALGDLGDPGDLGENGDGPGVLDEATVVALRLADLLTSDRPTVDEGFYDELRVHFSDGQILELGSALAVASGWQRFIEAFGIRPDGPWVEQFQAGDADA